jgi:hypothetical protein
MYYCSMTQAQADFIINNSKGVASSTTDGMPGAVHFADVQPTFMKSMSVMERFDPERMTAIGGQPGTFVSKGVGAIGGAVDVGVVQEK